MFMCMVMMQWEVQINLYYFLELLLGIGLGIFKGFKFSNMMSQVAENLKSVTGAIVILLFVGALSGTWLISGIIPSMIYYGLNILHPSIFLPACLIICAIISIATGSSWTTSATVGIALIGISKGNWNSCRNVCWRNYFGSLFW